MAQFSCRTPFEPIVTLKTKEKPKENSIKQQTKPPSQISPTTTPPKPRPNLQTPASEFSETRDQNPHQSP